MNRSLKSQQSSRSRANLLVRVGLGLVLAALSYLCAVFVINVLAQDACLNAGGKLEAGDICVLPNMATQSAVSLLKGPVIGAIFGIAALAAVFTWFSIFRERPGNGT